MERPGLILAAFVTVTVSLIFLEPDNTRAAAVESEPAPVVPPIETAVATRLETEAPGTIGLVRPVMRAPTISRQKDALFGEFVDARPTLLTATSRMPDGDLRPTLRAMAYSSERDAAGSAEPTLATLAQSIKARRGDGAAPGPASPIAALINTAQARNSRLVTDSAAPYFNAYEDHKTHDLYRPASLVLSKDRDR